MKKMIGDNCYLLVLLLFMAACRPETAITPSPSVVDFQVVTTMGTAVVVSDVAALRPLPDIQSTNMALVERDTRLNVIGKLADESWYQVEIPGEDVPVVWLQALDGVTALWVAAAFVELPATDASPEPTTTSTLPPATPTSTSTATVEIEIEATPTATATPCVLPPGWAVYTVRAGDTLGRIAQAVGATVPQLMLANCLVNDLIITGQELYVPRLPPQPSATPTATASAAPIATLTVTATGTPSPAPRFTPTFTSTPAP